MRDIKGYEGLYAVTSCGKVWSYKSKKFLKPYSNGHGYLIVRLCKNGEQRQFQVHRLVAEAYLQNSNNLPQVNHKDEVKTHNWINNLEWCDTKYNIVYSQAKKIKCVETNQIFESQNAAARELGISQGAISEVCRGKRKLAGGLHWEYVKEGEFNG